MTEELKTLKDINDQIVIFGNPIRCVMTKELKAEAVKRAKNHLENSIKAEKLSKKESYWYWRGRIDEALILTDQTEEDKNENKN